MFIQFSDCHTAYIDVRRVYFNFCDFCVSFNVNVFVSVVVHWDVEFMQFFELHEERECVDIFDGARFHFIIDW